VNQRLLRIDLKMLLERVVAGVRTTNLGQEGVITPAHVGRELDVPLPDRDRVDQVAPEIH
jgi:hypothetical protein